MTPEAFERAIDELGLTPVREEILRVAKPCLNFITRPAEEPVPVTRSKIGGVPELPEGVEWPADPRTPMYKQCFFGRICAHDLQRIYPGLQEDLLFFGDWANTFRGTVIGVAPGTPVFPAEVPEFDYTDPLEECEVTVEEAISLPCYADKITFSEEVRTFGGVKNPLYTEWDYIEYPITDLIELTEKIEDPSDLGCGIIRCGGYPIFVQTNDPRRMSRPLEEQTREQLLEWESLMCFGEDGPAMLGMGFSNFLVRPAAITAGEPLETIFYHDH